MILSHWLLFLALFHIYISSPEDQHGENELSFLTQRSIFYLPTESSSSFAHAINQHWCSFQTNPCLSVLLDKPLLQIILHLPHLPPRVHVLLPFSPCLSLFLKWAIPKYRIPIISSLPVHQSFCCQWLLSLTFSHYL